MKNKNIGINSVLNVIRSSLSIIFPLITFPYALRVLGTISMGKISYTLSIISYFTLLAQYGISTYAIREGSKIRENKEKFTIFANNIFSINIYSTGISYFLLFIVILTVEKLSAYKILLLFQSITMILGTVGIEWVNTIYEDYLSVTIRSILSYLIIIPLLFLFVKKESDIYIYILISIASTAIVNWINWRYCKKYVHIKFVLLPNFKPHMKYLTIFFINSIMITIYVNIDTTMLGWIKGDYSVGIYSTATKIYTVIKQLLVSIYVVSVPRLTYYFSQNNYFDYKKLFSNMICYMTIILLPASFGLICISEGVIYFVGGSQYLDAILPLQILCISLIFALFGGLITLCLNVSIGMEKNNLKGSIIGALLNLILNFYFIPKYSYIGAAVTTTISEMVVFLYCFFSTKDKEKYFDFAQIKRMFIDSIFGCIGIYLVFRIVNFFINDIFVKTISIVLISVVIYFFILYLRKNSILNELFLKLNKNIVKLKRR